MTSSLNTPLKIIFAGTPDFAAKHLSALIASQHKVVAVYCPPDKPAGRGKKLTSCATKVLAEQHQIPVVQPLNFKEEVAQQTLANYQADIMVVVAYGVLLPEVILSTPRLGCINVHGSLLPKWRGAAPIQRSLEAGDAETGVTIMQMDKGLDTGDMILKSSTPILATDTSATLYEKLADLGPKALLTCLEDMANNIYSRTPQPDHLVSYAKKLTKEEAEIDWALPAHVIDKKIRAFFPWPTAYYYYQHQEKKVAVKVIEAKLVEQDHNAIPGTILSTDKQGVIVATGDQALQLTLLQMPGKKALPIQDILNGRSDWFTVNQPITGK